MMDIIQVVEVFIRVFLVIMSGSIPFIVIEVRDLLSGMSCKEFIQDILYAVRVHSVNRKCKRWRQGKSHVITISPHEVSRLARILYEYHWLHNRRYTYIIHTITSYYRVTKDKKIGFILDKFGMIRYTNLGD